MVKGLAFHGLRISENEALGQQGSVRRHLARDHNVSVFDPIGLGVLSLLELRAGSQANSELFILDLGSSPVAKELPEILEPLRCEKLRKFRCHVFIADLFDLIQREELTPFDEAFPANGRIKCGKHAFKGRFERFDIGIDLGADNNRDPFQALVEFLVLLAADKE